MAKTSKEMLNAFSEQRKHAKDKSRHAVNVETCLLVMSKVLGDPPVLLKNSTLEFRRAFSYIGTLITNRDWPLKSRGTGNQQDELEERGFDLYKLCKPKTADFNLNLNCPKVREFLDLSELKNPIFD